MPIRFVSIQTGNNLLQYTVPFVNGPQHILEYTNHEELTKTTTCVH